MRNHNRAGFLYTARTGREISGNNPRRQCDDSLASGDQDPNRLPTQIPSHFAISQTAVPSDSQSRTIATAARAACASHTPWARSGWQCVPVWFTRLL